MKQLILLTTEQALEAIQKRRANALDWWNKLSIDEKVLVIEKYTYTDKEHVLTLTDNQIENIWRAEMNNNNTT